jgi:hypothetical protein
MSLITNTDNIYAVGTILAAKVNPELKLVIMRYFQRIYYCAVVGEPERKHFAYYERELIAPAAADNGIQKV